MKSLLFFLAIYISFGTNAQIEEQLIPFTNYGSCYQGLKYPSGKIVWEADFESLEKIHDYEYIPINPNNYMISYYWVVEKNGAFGFINPEGEQILPFRFNKIKSAYPWRKGVIASDDSGSYLYSNSGEIELTFDGYSWFEVTENGYIVENNGQFGLLDFEQTEILPTIYDQLEIEIVQHYDETIPEIKSNRFVRTVQNDQSAMFDLKRKDWVIPKTSEVITPHWVAPCKQSDVLFQLSNDAGNSFRMVRGDGNEVYSSTKQIDAEIKLISLDSCGTSYYQLMYVSTDESMEVINLKDGKRSEEYPLIYPLDGYSIFFEKKNWGVLDPDLNLLGRFKYPKKPEKSTPRKGTPKRQHAEFLFYQYFAWDYYEWFSQQGILTDSILITRQPSASDRKDDYYGDKYGLFNFRSGKKVKVGYDGLWRQEYEGKTILWASNILFQGYEMENEITTLDIYNIDLERINSFSGKIYLGRVYDSKYREYQEIQLNGKFGVLNLLGEEIIPIRYDECQPKEIQSIDDISIKEPLFIARKEGKPITIFDFQGNVLIQKNYSEISIHGQLLIASRTDHLKDVYDSKGNLLLEGFKYHRNSPRIDEFGQCIGFEDQKRFLPSNCTYFTKGDQVYEFRAGKMHLLDENFFQFSENYCFFLGWIIIDKVGKIVTTHPRGVSRLSVRHRQENPTECSTYLNEYPVPEPPKKEIKPYVPPKQSHTPSTLYTWKQHDRNKANEWFLYNRNDVLMYPESFEYPLPVEDFYGGVFMQNGKYGYFDSKYNQYLEAEYDYIYPPAPITLKNGKWQIHHRNSGRVSPEFDAISLDYRNYLHFVFNDGKIGLINDSMEFIIPLTDSAQLVNNYDLVKLLDLRGYPGQTRMYILNNLVYNGIPSRVYRPINNTHLLEQVTQNSTKNHLLKFSPIDVNRANLPTGLFTKVMYFNENQTIREREPTHANRYFYSERTFTSNRNWSDESWTYLRYPHLKFREFFNYKIVGDELIPIQFSDLFKPDQQSVDRLNKIIIDKLTKIQAFGENCTDIDEKLTQLKQKFTIHNGKELLLYWQNVGGFVISLELSEVEELLLEPKKLMEKS